jgi:predicted DNA-binding protein
VKEEQQVQTAIRLSPALLKRIDKLADRMSRPGVRATRADVHREAVFLGVELLEARHK